MDNQHMNPRLKISKTSTSSAIIICVHVSASPTLSLPEAMLTVRMSIKPAKLGDTRACGVGRDRRDTVAVADKQLALNSKRRM